MKAVVATDNVIDYEQHWSSSLDTYKAHPTSRHRRRFVMGRMERIRPAPGQFVFDYGCGAGLLLEQIQSQYGLPDGDLGGCDISQAGIEAARGRIKGGSFFASEFPKLERSIDVAITSEVIEHTADYERILGWLAKHLRPGGDLIITTPGGTMDPPDQYYGHIQHFTIEQLTAILERLGLAVNVARYWGFPLFTLQKWVTKRNFDRIRERYMHGSVDARKRAIFSLTYYAYFVHDLIPAGPQIFIHATKIRAPRLRVVPRSAEAGKVG